MAFSRDQNDRRLQLRSSFVLDMRGIGQRFVYVLRSESDPTRHYVGRTSNIDERLDWHNQRPSGQMKLYRSWTVVVSIEFPNERAAGRFEHYLKSGSGRAFANRHFAPIEDA